VVQILLAVQELLDRVILAVMGVIRGLRGRVVAEAVRVHRVLQECLQLLVGVAQVWPPHLAELALTMLAVAAVGQRLQR
jgi:hypothetical protein